MVTRIKTKYPVINELLNVYSEALTSIISDKQDVSRIMNVRCSSLPFCSLSFFINHATNGVYRYLDLKGSFYTSVGTAVHTAVQNHLALSGKFLANWKCNICNTKYKLSMQHECCDFPCSYDEVHVEYKGISGHIDAIFKDSSGNFWIVDYKTTSNKSALSKSKNPGIVYKEQIETYALLMWLQYKIKIKGVMLFFIPRDDLTNPTVYCRLFTDVMLNKVKVKTIKYIKAHKQALAVTTLKEALALLNNGKCKNLYCKVCTKTNIKSLLTEAYRIGITRKNVPLTNIGK